MASKPGKRILCGAKSKRVHGKTCGKWAVNGSHRCRIHGGTQPRGGIAKAALNRLKHGLFAKTMTPDEESAFADAMQAALDDPTVGMLADAQFLRVKAATVAARAKAGGDGMYTAVQSAVKKTEPVIDNETGLPVPLRDEYGHVVKNDEGLVMPAMKVTETISAERRDIIGPVSELLMRAAKLTTDALLLKKKAGIVGDDEVGALTEDSMADILRREFNDAGGLNREDDDGHPRSQGAGRPRQGG